MSLQELQQKALAIPGLEQKLAHLKRSIETAEREKHNAARIHAKEQQDVERLENTSLTSFIFKLVGQYDNKLEKEQQDEIHAKLAYDKAVTHLAVLQEERTDTLNRLSELRNYEIQYEKELRTRRNLLSISDDEKGQAFLVLEKQIAEIITQQTEVAEANSVANKALNTANRVLKSLDSAEGWATFDLFVKGGILTHMAKYSHIDEAEETLHTLAAQMQELQEELGDIHGMDVGNLDGLQGISGGQRFVDFWFDNIFTDWSVKSKIGNNADEVKQIANNLRRIQSALNTRQQELTRELSRLQKKEEALVSQFNPHA